MKKTLCAAVAVAGLLVATAACGSSGGTSAAPPSSGGTSNSSGTAATGEPIKIAMLAPLNTQFFATPDQIAAVKAAVASINASGGVRGRPLQLDWCNEANDVNKASACARSFVSNGDVATVGSITAFAGAQVAPILANAQIAGVVWHALQAVEFASPNNFPFDGATPWEEAALAGAAIKIEGVKKIAVARTDSPSTVPTQKLIEQVTEKLGGQVVKTVLIPTTAIADYSSYAQQLISSGADLALIPVAKTNAIGLINAARQLGSNIKFGTNAGAFADADLKELGAKADGMLISTPMPWIHDAADYSGVNDFLASMKAEQDRGDKGADVTTARPGVIEDWYSVYALRDVLTQMVDANTPITAPNVLAAFNKATDLSTNGLTADPWSPSKKQTAVPGYPTVANTRSYLLEVKNGEQKLLQKDPIDLLSYLQ